MNLNSYLYFLLGRLKDIILNKILILFAHPAFQKSRINKILVQGLKDMEGITFHDLYQLYPEHDIVVKTEQKLLEEHDIIIFHHPFYWYGAPSILKEWQDLVLEHGWAYGHEAEVLIGKPFLQVLTTGGGMGSYHKDGFHRFTIRELLRPFEQSTHICQMRYLPPFVVDSTHILTKDEVLQQRKHYLELLTGLRDEQFDLEKLDSMEYFNEFFIKK